VEPYTYELKPDLIAQRPVHPPELAQMIVTSSERDLLKRTFADLPDFCGATDLFVFNNSAVIPARLFGWIANLDKEIEVLLLRQIGQQKWIAIGRPMRALRRADTIFFSEGVQASVDSAGRDELLLTFSIPDGASFLDLLSKIGTMPIPPYIRQGRGDEQDRIDYQTIFAENVGSVAAPTASLHFTPALVQRLKDKGAHVEFLTLHVGSASFRVIEPGCRPDSEEFFVSEATLRRLLDWKKQGGRIIAVGTTVVRALESAVRGFDSKTDLFITPGFTFQLVDALITNFHQPGTTHLLLVEAFLGRDKLAELYEYAVASRLRFLSYGDGVFITERL
jgi:S-adenosylmethionine:tRNA ribosyltransferase-isomerase